MAFMVTLISGLRRIDEDIQRGQDCTSRQYGYIGSPYSGWITGSKQSVHSKYGVKEPFSCFLLGSTQPRLRWRLGRPVGLCIWPARWAL